MRTSPAGTVTSPFVPTAVTLVARSDEFTFVRMSTSLPGTFSLAFSIAAVNASGPQSWWGEIESYGSGTETRYGTGWEFQTSPIAAVRPPEVE